MPVVIKFGGSNLDSPEGIRRAADMVSEYRKRGVVVVVSAMKGETDRLSKIYRECTDCPNEKELDAILSVGEMTAARLFASALRSREIEAKEIVPNGDKWLIATDSKFGGANPEANESRERIRAVLSPHLENGTVPVVCGFLGVDNDGNITTLGRGGSDCTATLISNAIGAEELILVKDTSGIMSADPKVVSSARPIEKINLKELWSLASSGSGVVQCRSLKYLNGAVFKIVPPGESEGTVVDVETEVMSKGPMRSVSIVGRPTPGLLQKAGGLFSEVQAVSTSSSSVSFFVEEDVDLGKIHDALLGVDGFVAITSRENLGLVEVNSPAMGAPGIISGISQEIAGAGVSIIEMTTSNAGIMIVVDYKDLEACSGAVKRALEGAEW